MTGRTITRSIIIIAATLVALPSAQAQSTSCTPQHLLSTLRQVETQCGSAKIVSSYRRGAIVRGTRLRSQHSYCNGANGAIDAVFGNRACALAALRKTDYTVLTYGNSPHIHVGTDGWGAGSRTRVARVHGRRVAAKQRVARRHWPRVAHRQSQHGSDSWGSFNSSW